MGIIRMNVETFNRKMVLIGLLTIALTLTASGITLAGISKDFGLGDDYCNLCHTGGTGTDGTISKTCLECHSSSSSSTTYTINGGGQTVVVPVVNYTGGSEPGTYLAGGNFWWVKEGLGGQDVKGHNVFPGEPDDHLSEAPGKNTGCLEACHGSLAVTAQGLYADRQGCLGCHMMTVDGTSTGFHHADDSDPVVGDAFDDDDGYYRFLTGHMSGYLYGVCGLEDDDWEATLSIIDHNEYLGYGGSTDSSGGFYNAGPTTTAFCTGCHGDFHIERQDGIWWRHPSDAGLIDTTYIPTIPIARHSLEGWQDANDTIAVNEDFVMCLSCHRAHASPYYKMLRWDPDWTPPEEDEARCTTCHTTKAIQDEDYHHVENCGVCHTPHEGTSNRGLINTIIDTPNSGPMQVVFSATTGPNSYADGDSTYDGVCEVCHTNTSHHRNDGNNPDPDPHYAGEDCIACHSHSDGFSHGGGSGTGCESCHGHDDGYGGAQGGAGTFATHSTHTENDADDLKGPNIGCSDCHNTDSYPDFTDATSLAATAVCDSCHSSGGGYDGVAMAKANWATGIYDYESDSEKLRSGNELWCATCHDTVPANSKQDDSGVDAPNVIGDEDAGLAEGYRYGTGYGFYKTGHGLASGTYPASGGPRANAECTDCHDVALAHIDHDSRTYAAADNNYQAGYRLAYSMDIPRVDSGWPISDFELCAQCHDMDPFFQKTNLTSNLRNVQTSGTSTDLSETVLTDSTKSWGVNEFLYDGTVLIPNIEKPWNVYTVSSNTANTITVSGSMLADGASIGNYRVVCNGHRYHLKMGPTGPMSPGSPNWDSDWSATSGGDMQLDSGISCTTCHNVHGSKYGRMVRDGELISKIYNRKPGLDFYYVDSGYSYAGPTTLPESIGGHWSNGARMCANCHGSPDARFYRAAKGTASLLSASNQYFSVGDSATEISTITITDNAQAGSLNSAGDIRIRIPDSLSMTWDTGDTSAVMGGTATGKVNSTVSFLDNKILLIDVTDDFAADDNLTVSGLSFTNFSAISAQDKLELYIDEGHVFSTEDIKTIQIGTKAVISSAADQAFVVDNGAIPISPVTIMAITDDAEINSSDDIRIKIPATFSMVWDTSDTSAVIGGTASGKVDGTVSFPDGKTLLIDVTSDFAEGDAITISDLKCESFLAASAADNLELYVDGASDVVADGLDDKTITIETQAWISPVDILRGQCSEEMSCYDTLIDNDLTTGNFWPGRNGIFDLGQEYLVTHIRIYAQYDNKWRVYVGNTPSDCLSDGTDVTGQWRMGHDGVRWYEMAVTQASGRYLRLEWDNVGGYPGNNTLMEIEFFGIPQE